MDLDWDPTLPRPLLDALERGAVETGLALDRLELLGQDERVARAFLCHVALGREASFLARVPWDALEERRRRRHAAVRRVVEELVEADVLAKVR